MMDTSVMQERIGQLCHQFKLPTMGAQSVARFTASGHGDALPIFLEVLEQEADDRAATGASTGCAGSPGCPRARPGKSSSMTGCLWPCASSWTNWPRAASSSAASTYWPSDCPAPARPTPFAPWATAWCRNCWPPSATWTCRLRKLDNFDFLLLDDLGCLPQGAERYERRSLGITSNLVFSEWERIFANPMATAAAIDRVVHHSVILEFDDPATGLMQPSNGARPRR